MFRGIQLFEHVVGFHVVMHRLFCVVLCIFTGMAEKFYISRGGDLDRYQSTDVFYTDAAADIYLPQRYAGQVYVRYLIYLCYMDAFVQTKVDLFMVSGFKLRFLHFLYDGNRAVFDDGPLWISVHVCVNADVAPSSERGTDLFGLVRESEFLFVRMGEQ